MGDERFPGLLEEKEKTGRQHYSAFTILNSGYEVHLHMLIVCFTPNPYKICY